MPQQIYLGCAGGLKTGVIELLDAVDENDHVIGCMSREDFKTTSFLTKTVLDQRMLAWVMGFLGGRPSVHRRDL